MAATHSHQESWGKKDRRYIKGRSEGRTHCLGHAAPLPHGSGPIQSTQPPRLSLVRQEDRKRPLSLYGEKSLSFSLAPLRESLIGGKWVWVFEKKNTVKEGKLIEYFGKEGDYVQIEEGLLP